jgi:hypothetical protein
VSPSGPCCGIAVIGPEMIWRICCRARGKLPVSVSRRLASRGSRREPVEVLKRGGRLAPFPSEVREALDNFRHVGPLCQIKQAGDAGLKVRH